MTMRQRKRRLISAMLPTGTPRVIHGRSSRARGPITFPPPSDTWGTVTHTIGPFVPLPARRDIRFERRLARMRDRIKAALVITEE